MIRRKTFSLDELFVLKEYLFPRLKGTEQASPWWKVIKKDIAKCSFSWAGRNALNWKLNKQLLAEN